MSDAAHGSVDAYWQDNMLVINISQAFNLAGVERATRELRRLIENRPVPQWVRCYVYLDDEGLGPPSGADAIIESIRYGKENGNRLICVVRGNLLNRENLSMLAGKFDLPIAFFDELDKARDFVKQSPFLFD